MSDEREEGEIVDEISSDEETCMRQRIKELEARNDELERIARLKKYVREHSLLSSQNAFPAPKHNGHVPAESTDNAFNYWNAQRAGLVPTDVSSISSTEFSTPKKKKHRKAKAAKTDKTHAKCKQYKVRCRRSRQPHPNQRHHGNCRKRKRVEVQRAPNTKDLETISLSSLENSDDYEILYEPEPENGLALSRAELRFALARSNSRSASAASNSLKKRLMQEKPVALLDNEPHVVNEEPILLTDVEAAPEQALDEPELTNDQSEDSDDSLKEHELRLLALKSAVLKKHWARKKRDAEIAYSPTDFDDMLTHAENAADDNIIDMVDVELDNANMQGEMEISPVTSPKLRLSPVLGRDGSSISLDSEIMCTEAVAHVDTKPVDMDIVNSESEDEHAVSQQQDCKWSIEHIPLPAGLSCLPEYELPMQLPYAAPSSLNFGNFWPEMQFENAAGQAATQAPPPPPACLGADEVAPPPPPFVLTSILGDDANIADDQRSDLSMECASGNGRESALSNEQATSIAEVHMQSAKSSRNCSPINTSRERPSVGHTPENSQDASKQRYQNENRELASDAEAETEEEVAALRALLLASYNSPKAKDKTKKKSLTPLQVQNSSAINEVQERCQDKQRSPLCHDAKPKKETPAELILKEAVRRLKVKSTQNHFSHEQVFKPIERPPRESCQKRQFNAVLPKVQVRTVAHINEDYERELKEQELQKTGKKKASIDGERQEIENISLTANNSDKKLKLASRTTPEAVVIENTLKLQEQNVNEDQVRELRKQEMQENRAEKTLPDFADASSKESNDNLKAPSEKLPAALPTANTLKLTRLENATISPQTVAVTTDKSATALENTCEQSQDSQTERATTKCQKVNCDNDDIPTTSKVQTVEATKPPLKPTNAPTKRPAPKALLAGNKKPAPTLSNNVQKQLVSSAPTPVPVLKPKITAATSSIPSSTKTTNTTTAAIKPKPSNFAAVLTKKIIKPNKIINTTVNDLKRKSPSEALQKANTTEFANKSGSRLITSTDLLKSKAKSIIITLRGSDTESSDYADPLEEGALSKRLTTRCDTPESLEHLWNYNYYENSNQMSPRQASGQSTPSRSNSPIAASVTKSTASVGSTVSFEQKLDNFLKNVRYKVHQSDNGAEVKSAEATPKVAQRKADNYNTPVAVRHLPAASQDEYRRLVHRMNMLEKQKQLKKAQGDNPNVPARACLVSDSAVSDNSNSSLNSASSPTQAGKAVLTSAATATANAKETLIKKVLLKNAATKKRTLSSSSGQTPSKTNVLRSYEDSFVKINAGLVSNLNKSLVLVEQARQVKIAKLRHEQRLKDLRAEVADIEAKLKLAEQKKLIIYPEIGRVNAVVTELKSRRFKLFKAAKVLGRTLKGDDYRLNDDMKKDITAKIHKISDAVKVINSLKYSDIAQLQAAEKAQLSADVDVTSEAKVGAEAVEQIATVTQQSAEIKDKAEMSAPVASQPNLSAVVNTEKSDLVESSDNCVQNAESSVNTSSQSPPPSATAQPEKTCDLDAHQQPKGKDNENQKEALANVSALEPPMALVEERKVLREYISPLMHFKTESSQLDPNGVICPYELMGQCEDNDCAYMHLTAKSDAASKG